MLKAQIQISQMQSSHDWWTDDRGKPALSRTELRYMG